jgi:hypothetical protein
LPVRRYGNAEAAGQEEDDMKKFLWFLATLAALGAVIMIVRSRRESSSDFDYSEWGAAPSDLTSRLNDTAKSAAASISSAAGTATDAVSSAAGDATDTVKAAAKDAAESAKAAARAAKDSATS